MMMMMMMMIVCPIDSQWVRKKSCYTALLRTTAEIAVVFDFINVGRVCLTSLVKVGGKQPIL